MKIQLLTDGIGSVYFPKDVTRSDGKCKVLVLWQGNYNC